MSPTPGVVLGQRMSKARPLIDALPPKCPKKLQQEVRRSKASMSMKILVAKCFFALGKEESQQESFLVLGEPSFLPLQVPTAKVVEDRRGRRAKSPPQEAGGMQVRARQVSSQATNTWCLLFPKVCPIQCTQGGVCVCAMQEKRSSPAKVLFSPENFLLPAFFSFGRECSCHAHKLSPAGNAME